MQLGALSPEEVFRLSACWSGNFFRQQPLVRHLGLSNISWRRNKEQTKGGMLSAIGNRQAMRPEVLTRVETVVKGPWESTLAIDSQSKCQANP